MPYGLDRGGHGSDDAVDVLDWPLFEEADHARHSHEPACQEHHTSVESITPQSRAPHVS